MLLLLTSNSTNAQIELAGHTYHRDFNIVSDLQILSDQLKVIPDTSKNALTVAEKEWIKNLQVINKAIIAYTTAKFIDNKMLKFQAVIRYDESRAMAGGVSYSLNNMMKKTFTNGSRTEKAYYTINGHTITAQSKKMKKKGETLTFELSNDGETLTYVTKFKRITLPHKK